MRGHKRRHLPAYLQIRHVAVQINPIHALQIQAYMPSKHIVYRHRLSHHHSLTATEPPHQTSCSAVRGEASLVTDADNGAGRLGEQFAQPILNETGVMEQGRLDSANRRVHHCARVGVAEVSAQLAD